MVSIVVPFITLRILVSQSLQPRTCTTPIFIFLGNGDGSFQAAQNFGAGRIPHSVAVGDFNGDGRPDLVVANNFSYNVSVLINNTAQ